MQTSYYNRFNPLAFGIFMLTATSLLSCQTKQETNKGTEITPADLVEPLVDAANSRWFFFNSATRPFGMINLSPDMVTSGAWNSGYRYNQDTIRAFSHIHAWQLSGIPAFPTTGAFEGHLGSKHYGSSYTHENRVYTKFDSN
ncbi:MAG: hypothetical protein K9H49_05570 [Bacteroidales bacterium]|nr:hypothetical protein [Bacteroidales bacterium]MCF8389592.1 hypothetical protein [Bacteroidales bacterium]